MPAHPHGPSCENNSKETCKDIVKSYDLHYRPGHMRGVGAMSDSSRYEPMIARGNQFRTAVRMASVYGLKTRKWGVVLRHTPESQNFLHCQPRKSPSLPR